MDEYLAGEEQGPLTPDAFSALDLPLFGAALAPIEARCSWQGSSWRVFFRILCAAEEQDVLAEAAGAGDAAQRAHRENVATIIRAIAAVEDTPVRYSLEERRRWVLGDGTKAWPGFGGPFIDILMDGYARAKHAIILSRARVAADPLFFSLPAEPSGDDSLPPPTSADDPSPPTSAPTSSDTLSETSMSGASRPA